MNLKPVKVKHPANPYLPYRGRTGADRAVDYMWQASQVFALRTDENPNYIPDGMYLIHWYDRLLRTEYNGDAWAMLWDTACLVHMVQKMGLSVSGAKSQSPYPKLREAILIFVDHASRGHVREATTTAGSLAIQALAKVFTDTGLLPDDSHVLSLSTLVRAVTDAVRGAVVDFRFSKSMRPALDEALNRIFEEEGP